jgi:enoyl-CoA hydratase/carnithine racemase
MDDVLLREDAGGIRMLKMNRPEALNALNTDLLQALGDAVSAADRDPAVRVLMISGVGPAFSAGLDFPMSFVQDGSGASFGRAHSKRYWTARRR